MITIQHFPTGALCHGCGEATGDTALRYGGALGYQLILCPKCQEQTRNLLAQHARDRVSDRRIEGYIAQKTFLGKQATIKTQPYEADSYDAAELFARVALKQRFPDQYEQPGFLEIYAVSEGEIIGIVREIWQFSKEEYKQARGEKCNGL